METAFVFAMGLRRVSREPAAPTFLAPVIAVGGFEKRFQRGDAGGYDAYV